MTYFHISTLYPQKGRNLSPVIKNLIEGQNSLGQRAHFIPFSFRLISSFRFRKFVRAHKEAVYIYHFGGVNSFFFFAVIGLLKVRHRVIFYHGTDLHAHASFSETPGFFIKARVNKVFSKLTAILSSKNILVSDTLRRHLWKGTLSKTITIDLGVPLNLFTESADWGSREKIIVFIDNNGNPVKNYPRAEEIVNQYFGEYKIVKVSNIPFQEVVSLYKNARYIINTSLAEGSPNSIKEALVCGCRVIGVDVGNVWELIDDYSGIKITSTNKLIYISERKRALNQLSIIKTCRKINSIFSS